jgi:hypothetical protein
VRVRVRARARLKLGPGPGRGLGLEGYAGGPRLSQDAIDAHEHARRDALVTRRRGGGQGRGRGQPRGEAREVLKPG